MSFLIRFKTQEKQVDLKQNYFLCKVHFLSQNLLSMKRLFLIQLFAILTTVSVLAQENTLLWKISGNNLKTDSYLLGTIHILCPDDFVMLDKVAKTIDKVDQVVFEVDLFKPENQAFMQQKMMSPVPNFFRGLEQSQINMIDSVLAANQMSIKMFDMLHPSAVMSLLTLKSFNCPDPMNVKSVEQEVHKLAANKKIGDLETMDFQLDIMTKLATPNYFYEYLKLYDEGAALTNTMVQAYKEQNLSDLEKIFSDPKWMKPEIYDMMLTQRNVRWVEEIPAKIADTQTLIAVGAGHLLGDTGLIKLLRDKGYTVTPIFD